jgi:hypothetical protein
MESQTSNQKRAVRKYVLSNWKRHVFSFVFILTSSCSHFLFKSSNLNCSEIAIVSSKHHLVTLNVTVKYFRIFSEVWKYELFVSRLFLVKMTHSPTSRDRNFLASNPFLPIFYATVVPRWVSIHSLDTINSGALLQKWWANPTLSAPTPSVGIMIIFFF